MDDDFIGPPMSFRLAAERIRRNRDLMQDAIMSAGGVFECFSEEEPGQNIFYELFGAEPPPERKE